MKEYNFEEIIQFAIKREEEAVQFYIDLQGKVKDPASKNLLFELENMERGHIKILESIGKEEIENYNKADIPNLSISEFMDDIEINPESTFQEVLIVAMKREEQAQKLYLNLFQQVQEGLLKNTFQKLADEEAKHKLMLEKIYDDEVLKEN